MKRLAIVLAAALLSASAAQAYTVLGYDEVLDLFVSDTWAEKVAFMKEVGHKFKRECRKGDGCAMVARYTQDGVEFSLIETFPTKDAPVFRIWCLRDIGTWRIRCGDDKDK